MKLNLNQKVPEWIGVREINLYLKPYHLAPGDTLYLAIRNRQIKIRCRGVWTSCVCFRLAGYSVTEVK